jgi:4-diphosphocytidyl-2-C-methyl-D-erythritol kinase
MQQVELHDDIRICHRDDAKILLYCDKPGVPLDHNNLVWQAVELVREQASLSYGAEINIIKRIPIAGGLAGGSSDAAAAIKGLNKLWKLGLSLKQMMNIGERLGMDVPYCLVGGTALVSGKGQKVIPLPPLPKQIIVIANPGIRVSTAEAYKALDDVLNWSEQSDQHSNDLISALKYSERIDIHKYLYNDFQTTISHKLPIVPKIIETMFSLDAQAAILSGSGPSVYCIANTRNHAHKIAEALSSLATFVSISSTLAN